MAIKTNGRFKGSPGHCSCSYRTKRGVWGVSYRSVRTKWRFQTRRAGRTRSFYGLFALHRERYPTADEVGSIDPIRLPVIPLYFYRNKYRHDTTVLLNPCALRGEWFGHMTLKTAISSDGNRTTCFIDVILDRSDHSARRKPIFGIN